MPFNGHNVKVYFVRTAPFRLILEKIIFDTFIVPWVFHLLINEPSAVLNMVYEV